jgi:hypothetical protein
MCAAIAGLGWLEYRFFARHHLFMREPARRPDGTPDSQHRMGTSIRRPWT